MKMFVMCVICTIVAAIWAWFAVMFFFWFDAKMKKGLRRLTKKMHSKGVK